MSQLGSCETSNEDTTCLSGDYTNSRLSTGEIRERPVKFFLASIRLSRNTIEASPMFDSHIGISDIIRKTEDIYMPIQTTALGSHLILKFCVISSSFASF